MKRARCSVLILNPSPDIFTPIRQMLPLALSEVAPAKLAPVVRSMLIGATCSSNSSSVSPFLRFSSETLDSRTRSEERRVGKDVVSTCRSRCPRYQSKIKQINKTNESERELMQ